MLACVFRLSCFRSKLLWSGFSSLTRALCVWCKWDSSVHHVSCYWGLQIQLQLQVGVCGREHMWKKQKCIIIEDECNCKTLKYLTFLSFSSLDSVSLSNEEDVTAVTDSSGNTLRIRRDTNRLPVRVVAPDNQVRWAIFFCHAAELNWIEITFLCWEYLSNKPKYSLLGLQQLQLDFQSNTDNHFFKYHSYY